LPPPGEAASADSAYSDRAGEAALRKTHEFLRFTTLVPGLALSPAMSRPLRIHVPGAPYHVCSRGNNKQCIFLDDEDREYFLHLLAKAVARFGADCVSYCLMGTHFHLLLIPWVHTLSRLMQQLNSTYCERFNRKHGRVGHVLQSRPTMKLVGDDSYLLTAFRYIALNPLEAGHVKRPEDWRWASYRAVCGHAPMPTFLTLDRVWRALDSADPQTGLERLLTFVNAGGVGEGYTALDQQLIYGGDRLIQRVDPLLAPHRTVDDFTYAHRFATRPPLRTVLDVPPNNQIAVDEAVRLAFAVHAYTLREIGECLGSKPSTVWSWVQRAEARRDAEVRLGHPTATGSMENRDLTPTTGCQKSEADA
jgi:REP element-mobilizing transposase RayT